MQLYKKWYIVSKILLTYFGKKTFYWSKKMFVNLRLKTEKVLKSQEQYIWTLKGPNNSKNWILF